MKKIFLKASWVIKAPRSAIYEIMSDFESMPKNFPSVAQSLKIVERDGNNLVIEALAKSLGPAIPVTMRTTLIPQKGYISDNINPVFRATGHEEFLMEDVEGGTQINYSYDYDISKSNILLQIFAKPVFGWFSMWFWERAVIGKLKVILSCD